MKSSLLLAASLATAAAAQVPQDLDARIQLFGEVIRPTSITVAAGIKDQAGSSGGVGIRFMGEFSSPRNWYYEIGGKLDSSSTMKLNSGGLDLTDVKFTQSYWLAGIGYMAPLGGNVALGFHLEGRGEALAAQGAVFQGGVITGRADASTTYLRPWFRLSLDGSFRMGSLRPFVGAEVAATPVKTSQTALVAISAMDTRTLRAMAPNVSGAFYMGLHF